MVASSLLPAMHPGVVMSLVELASIDNVITLNEIAMLRDIAAHLERGTETLDQWLELHRMRPDIEYGVADPEPKTQIPQCTACSLELPEGARFCMKCGARLGG